MTSKVPPYLPSLGRLLGFASTATTTLSERRLRKHGLTLRQWIALTALWRNPGISESELATYCRTSPSALNRLLDRMEVKGLVKRRRDPQDGRRVLVQAASVGKRKAPLLDFYREINATLLRGFSAGEARQIVALLERLVSNVERALEDH